MAIHSTHIKHTIRHICSRVDFAVTGFERPIRCTHDATEAGLSIQSSLGLITVRALSTTASTHVPRQVHHPRLPKLINVARLFPPRKYEVVATVLVVVAAETTRLTLVCRRHDHLNIIDCVIEDCQSKVCSDDYVATFLGDPDTPIIQGQREVYIFIINLEKKKLNHISKMFLFKINQTYTNVNTKLDLAVELTITFHGTLCWM